jgi:uncharacterized coiled-coil DUF342 family protein
MLLPITWPEYIVAISIALVAYYLILVVVYYKNEISNLIFKKDQEKDDLRSKNDKLGELNKDVDSLYDNQAEDNMSPQFDNGFNFNKEFEEKDSENSLIDEASATTSARHEAQTELFAPHQKYTPQLQETDDRLQQVQELTAELKEVIAQAVDKNYIKEELISSLQSLIKKHSFLKGSPFSVSVNNLIASECEKYGYIQLSAEEQVMLWNE